MAPLTSRTPSAVAALWAKPRPKPAPPPFAPRTPAWARALINQVCVELGVALPYRTNWRVNDRSSSSGKQQYRLDPGNPNGGLRLSLLVSAGHDVRDARHVLLHELAHFLDDDHDAKVSALVAKSGTGRRRQAVRPRQDPHNQAFFARAIPLFERHGDYSLAEAVEREVKTYPRHRYDLAGAAIAAGHSELIEVIGATAAAQRRARRRPPIVEVPIHAIEPVKVGKLYHCRGCDHRLGKVAMAQIDLANRRGFGPLRHQVLSYQSA